MKLQGSSARPLVRPFSLCLFPLLVLCDTLSLVPFQGSISLSMKHLNIRTSIIMKAHVSRLPFMSCSCVARYLLHPDKSVHILLHLAGMNAQSRPFLL